MFKLEMYQSRHTNSNQKFESQEIQKDGDDKNEEEDPH